MAHHDEGFFSAKDNLRLFWESDYPDDPRAHVGLVHGYGDHCARYRKLVEHLNAQGLATHAFDYRGHGQADGRRGFCDRFSEYVDDLELFWLRVLKAAGGRKCFLFAHSHGGLIALEWLRTRSPQLPAGLILCAPWLELGRPEPKLKVVAAKLAGKIVPWLRVDKGIASEELTRDVEMQRATDRDPLYNREATPRWYTEATAAQKRVRAAAQEIRLPILMLCGDQDTVASTPTSREYFERLGSPDKTYRAYPEMRHELWGEVGKEQVWAEISGWISSHL